MTERYLVRCTAHPRGNGRLVGVYASESPACAGMDCSWKLARATHFNTESAATDVATRLSKKFVGTVWAAEPAEVVQ